MTVFPPLLGQTGAPPPFLKCCARVCTRCKWSREPEHAPTACLSAQLSAPCSEGSCPRSGAPSTECGSARSPAPVSGSQGITGPRTFYSECGPSMFHFISKARVYSGARCFGHIHRGQRAVVLPYMQNTKSSRKNLTQLAVWGLK